MNYRFVPRNPATNSRLLSLSFGNHEKIESNPEWIQLYNELKEINLFSMFYEETMNFDDYYIKQQLMELQKEYRNIFKKSRLNMKYIIIQFGLEIFTKVFGITFPIDLKRELIIFDESEKEIMLPLLDQFKSWCRLARNYDPTIKQACYITRKLENETIKHKKWFMFKQPDLTDFNNFTKEKHTMKSLFNRLYEGINNIRLINNTPYKNERVIRIDPDLLYKIQDSNAHINTKLKELEKS